MDNFIIEAFKHVLPLFSDLLQEDISTAITDRERCLVSFINPKVPVAFKAGDIIPHDNPLYLAMEKKMIFSAVVPKEAFGIDFLAIAYPIKDENGHVIGAIGVGKSLEKQSAIESTAKGLFSSLDQTGEAVADITTGSQRLSTIINNIMSAATDTSSKINETDSIIASIQSIASQSNLLALNAAIEAARAGESGKGFSVVAQEMKKLSQNSSESSKRVLESLTAMKKSIETIIRQINEANEVAEGHAAATEEMNATLDEITSMSRSLVNQSGKA